MSTLALALSNRYFPRMAAWQRESGLLLTGSLLVALFAQVRIPLPFTPVPITGQTFAVLLVGAALGARRGAAALTLYLLEGALGLPFFAGGRGGLHVLSGATAGYLFGFVLAAWLTGRLAERGLERNVRTSLLPFVAGSLVIYICGLAWLTVVRGSLRQAIILGLLPFLPGDAVKLLAAALALPAAWRLLKGTDRPSEAPTH